MLLLLLLLLLLPCLRVQRLEHRVQTVLGTPLVQDLGREGARLLHLLFLHRLGRLDKQVLVRLREPLDVLRLLASLVGLLQLLGRRLRVVLCSRALTARGADFLSAGLLVLGHVVSVNVYVEAH